MAITPNRKETPPKDGFRMGSPLVQTVIVWNELIIPNEEVDSIFEEI
jgi:hypothetical protein